jgi:hypothetical protein
MRTIVMESVCYTDPALLVQLMVRLAAPQTCRHVVPIVYLLMLQGGDANGI